MDAKIQILFTESSSNEVSDQFLNFICMFFSGEKNFFFHGNESSNHICKCFEDNTCPYEECNCNKYGSAQDSGIIRSKSLPIKSMNYGPITTGEGMKFKAQIGDLKCSGANNLICKYT